MMPKPTSAAEHAPVRVVIVTLDSHLASAVERARAALAPEIPGLEISLHAAATWASDPAALEDARAAIATGDIIIANMLFIEEHIQAVLPALEARRDACDAMVCCLAAGEIVRQTRLGKFRMSGEQKGIVALLKRLRGSSNAQKSNGAQQMAMLRRLPKILRFIPGTAQDVRAYFLTLQYWLAGSDDNIANMIRLLVSRYSEGRRGALRGRLVSAPPVEYPEVGVYHPRLTADGAHPITEKANALPQPNRGRNGRVGLLIMRSYVLAGNTRHYDAVIAALEARGLDVVPAFASGLDARPAIERFFLDADGRSTIDALVSLTGFSLVGGPAYNDASAAADILGRLDVPYLAAHAVEFQTIEQWQASERGLTPIEATMMVAIPEIDGATGPMIFGGRSDAPGSGNSRDMVAIGERIEMLAARVAKLVALRRTPKSERRIAIVLFSFPPNAGNVGTAAFLSVYASLFNTLKALAREGYAVEVPESVDALREAILEGNAKRFGAIANVAYRVSVDDHVRGEPHLAEIEAQWGPAPGRQQTDGSTIHVLGARFGNVLVGIQPGMGYEGDPMRLLFERGFAPTHAFSAFYTYLKRGFGAHAVLHFGTHGALEFMPGNQTALSAACWPDRLIGELPNIYLYAANNPSEGSIAKRRAAATLVSYLTPPVGQAGLYRGLLDLKTSLERWRGLSPDLATERAGLAAIIQAQAAAVELAEAEPVWGAEASERIDRMWEEILEVEYALIPHGLHVVGTPASPEERVDLITAMDDAMPGEPVGREAVERIVRDTSPGPATATAKPAAGAERLIEISRIDRLLRQDNELDGILTALDARFVAPSPSGDLIRTPDILPTGRNIHGFDPFRMPSAFAMADGRAQSERLIARHLADGNPLPETVAVVLWGTDNLKSEGGPIGQVLALIGGAPRFDSYGRLCGARLLPLAELGRPRIDVVVTLSGIFRDLLPLQTRMLAEVAYLAATADEPVEQNFVRKHALEQAARHNTDLETAALRVFSNAEGAYGSNVSMMVESGCWQEEDELAEAYTRRKGFAYRHNGAVVQKPELLESVLSGVSLAYQNLESVELGITTIDHYFDTLGGISRAVRKAGGQPVPVYIGDQTRGAGTVRTLSEQIALETRSRTLNPKWYEGMLKHGYEGVRQIEASVTNTVGWSATTGQVAPWVYQQITEIYLMDPEMRARLAALNPTASVRVANRLIEAHERNYWTPDEAVLSALRAAGEELEDRLEGIGVEAAA